MSSEKQEFRKKFPRNEQQTSVPPTRVYSLHCFLITTVYGYLWTVFLEITAYSDTYSLKIRWSFEEKLILMLRFSEVPRKLTWLEMIFKVKLKVNFKIITESVMHKPTIFVLVIFVFPITSSRKWAVSRLSKDPV